MRLALFPALSAVEATPQSLDEPMSPEPRGYGVLPPQARLFFAWDAENDDSEEEREELRRQKQEQADRRQ
ncbi:hypothetical protein NW762_003359 [Fusarium torreyae]|uniref:Uncharacterized protein n=1 Tax=Fusarium torreyae TaxID=1237075 RepID=A0A9W8SAL6_9HYPO|nr:hypothetical protein NW762_003359 [Fusarium torreyae]